MVWVAGGSILERLGMKMGDTIQQINGRTVTSAAEFFQVLGFSSPERLTASVLRNGESTDLRL